MSRVLDFVPQRVTVHAPRDIVFEIAAKVAYSCLPDSGRNVTVISRDAVRTLATFSTLNVHGQTDMVKSVTVDPPDRITYLHLAGPHAGTIEDLYFRPVEADTEIVLKARLPVADEGAFRLLRLAFEHTAFDHLCDLKAAAEQHAASAEARDDAAMLVPVPPLETEADLRAAVELQEESEWGHVGHSRGVARIAVSLSESVMLHKRQVDALVSAALLHDVGKVALSSTLWGTRGVLSQHDRTIMQSHTQFGVDLASRAGIPEPVLATILHHHERWDGAGYPNQLAGEAIPLRVRILAIAESIDSMMRATYRREIMSTESILLALEQDNGRRWDPMLAREACRIIRGR